MKLSEQADRLSGPIADLGGQTSPEVPYALSMCSGLQTALRTLADQYGVVARVCTDYAECLTSAHHGVITQLLELVASEAVIEIVGAVASAPDAGAAEAPTQAVASSRAAVTAGRVAKILMGLAEDVATLENLADAVHDRALSVLTTLQQLTDERETLQAVTALVDAGIPPVDLQANEDANAKAHVIREHVAKTDSYLIGRNIPVASTFVSLAAATAAVSVLMAAKAVEISTWLSGQLPTLPLTGPLAAGLGRSYLRKSGRFVSSTKVVIILERTANG